MGREKNCFPHRIEKHLAQVAHCISREDKIFCGALCHIFAVGEETQG